MLNKEKFKIGYTVTYHEKIDLGLSIDSLEQEYKEIMEKHLGDTTSSTLCTITDYKNDMLVLKTVWGKEVITTADKVRLTQECEREYTINNLLK